MNEEWKSQYDPEDAKQRLVDAKRISDRLRAAGIRVYDPRIGYGQRPIRLQAVKQMSTAASLFLYVWEVAWMTAVMGVFLGIVWR